MAEARRGKVSAGPGLPAKDAILVDVVEMKEPWNEYSLADGSIIKSKTVMTEIWRIENEWDAEGNPSYVMKASGIMSINAPDSLKPPKH